MANFRGNVWTVICKLSLGKCCSCQVPLASILKVNKKRVKSKFNANKKCIKLYI